MQFAGWIKYSYIDYPGKIATTLFCSGCNLRCPYCHNPDLVDGSAESRFSRDEINAFIDKRRHFIEGVVISGGEPTLQKELEPFIRAVRTEKRLPVKLDTNGLLPDMIARIAPDYLALDVKTLPSLYGPLLRSPYDDSAARLAKSIDAARAMGENAEIRITVAPELVDERIVTELSRLIMGVKRVFLQPMQHAVPLLDPEWGKKQPVPAEKIREYRDILAKCVERCEIR
jgi:pyruvate formate lyase activating enzyme